MIDLSHKGVHNNLANNHLTILTGKQNANWTWTLTKVK